MRAPSATMILRLAAILLAACSGSITSSFVRAEIAAPSMSIIENGELARLLDPRTVFTDIQMTVDPAMQADPAAALLVLSQSLEDPSVPRHAHWQACTAPSWASGVE